MSEAEILDEAKGIAENLKMKDFDKMEICRMLNISFPESAGFYISFNKVFMRRIEQDYLPAYLIIKV